MFALSLAIFPLFMAMGRFFMETENIHTIKKTKMLGSEKSVLSVVFFTLQESC